MITPFYNLLYSVIANEKLSIPKIFQ